MQNGNFHYTAQIKNSVKMCLKKKGSTFLLLHSVSVSKLNEFIKDCDKSLCEEM